MAVCPWCKAEVRDPSEPCPRCGKRAVEDVPDLIIPTRHASPKAPPKPVSAASAASQAPRAPPPRSQVASNQVGGSSTVFDDDPFGEASAPLALDLDLSHGPPMPIAAPGAPRGGAASSAAVERTSIGQIGAASSAKMSSRPPASGGARGGGAGGGAGKSVQSAPISSGASQASTGAGAPEAFAIAVPKIDPFEARALADYGPPPAGWWMTPLYAYRVKKRQPELKRALAMKRDEAERAETAAEDALMAFANRVRPAAQGNPRYAETLQEVVQTEELFRARDTALAGETDAHKQRQAQLEAGIVDLEMHLAAAQAEERVIQGELAEADALLKRADARVKRAEIEIRNATAHLEPKPSSAK